MEIIRYHRLTATLTAPTVMIMKRYVVALLLTAFYTRLGLHRTTLNSNHRMIQLTYLVKNLVHWITHRKRRLVPSLNVLQLSSFALYVGARILYRKRNIAPKPPASLPPRQTYTIGRKNKHRITLTRRTNSSKYH